MKYILILAVVLTSCYSKNQAHVKSRTDSTKVSVIYAINSDWKKDSAVRIIKDTFKVGVIDSSKGKAEMIWMKDTLYFVPLLIDSISKKAQWYGLPPQYVQEVHIAPLITQSKK